MTESPGAEQRLHEALEVVADHAPLASRSYDSVLSGWRRRERRRALTLVILVLVVFAVAVVVGVWVLNRAAASSNAIVYQVNLEADSRVYTSDIFVGRNVKFVSTKTALGQLPYEQH